VRLSRYSMGVGDLVPSQPGLPFWPSGSGMGDLVGSQPGLPFWASCGPMANYGMSGLADLVLSAPGLPFWASGSGMGDCGCGGSCGHCGGGMGALTDDLSSMFSNLTSGNFSGAWTNFTSAMTEPIFGTVPLWVVAGGALLVYAMVFSGGKHSRYQRGRKASAAARAAYA